ncbi:MAG: hypothetical protein HC772_02645 [Leptolyngbyaceae cyanobacterium CRU_2_3]|nr:hypothetical protein [Leptolyngbyaceae cyanobacterium CRU_2_3]
MTQSAEGRNLRHIRHLGLFWRVALKGLRGFRKLSVSKYTCVSANLLNSYRPILTEAFPHHTAGLNSRVGSLVASLAIALLLICSGCSLNPMSEQPIVSPTVQHAAGSPATLATPSPELVDLLKAHLAAKLGISLSEITLKFVEAVDWNDSCLGAAQPDEFCLMVITPGYRIALSTPLDPTRNYVFHTDRRQSFREQSQ